MNKYLLLPLHLLKFWYPESLTVFMRTWKNLISVIEEDLAVTLMIKLLWIPMFHDTTFLGRIMSFLFRVFRIFLGFFAYLSATIALICFALIWFLSPLFLLFS